MQIALQQRSRKIRRKGLRRKFVVAAVTLAAVSAVVAVRISKNPASAPSTIGVDGILSSQSADVSRPTPSAESGKPLGTPPPLPTAGGNYHFLAMQQHEDAPVAYDPCRPIRYVVNAESAPPGSQQLIDEAIKRVSKATGLTFQNDGSTKEVPGKKRAPFQPAVYGDMWAPLIFWWATPDHEPSLQGAVAGWGGSSWIELNNSLGTSNRVYVSGAITLDGPQLAQMITSDSGGHASARAVILHELGHVLGLDHVNDPTQIMNPEGSSNVTEFSTGDLRGLNELGRGRCVTGL